MVDYKAIARAIIDLENQPHQWTQLELAQFFTGAADEIERLREAIKVQANAAKNLAWAKDQELTFYKNTRADNDTAIKTLDSEREANAVLTDEIERLREALKNEIDDHAKTLRVLYDLNKRHMSEIERLRSMTKVNLDAFHNNVAEIERLRKFIKEHDMAEALEDWENA